MDAPGVKAAVLHIPKAVGFLNGNRLMWMDRISAGKRVGNEWRLFSREKDQVTKKKHGCSPIRNIELRNTGGMASSTSKVDGATFVTWIQIKSDKPPSIYSSKSVKKTLWCDPIWCKNLSPH